jgi:hypothetical protein
MVSTWDFIKIILSESVVPRAQIDGNDFDISTIIQLRRLLDCRGLKTTGNRTDLLTTMNKKCAVFSFIKSSIFQS